MAGRLSELLKRLMTPRPLLEGELPPGFKFTPIIDIAAIDRALAERARDGASEFARAIAADHSRVEKAAP